MKCLILAAAVVVLLAATPVASAEEYSWQVNYQHVTLDLSKSGAADITYQVDATIEQGTWTEVWIPLTTRSMSVMRVVDGSGKSHEFTVDKDSMQIKAAGFNLHPGDRVSLVINSYIPGFVYRSDTPGYDIVSYIPPWWDMTLSDTSVEYLLPRGVNESDVFTGTRQYTGIGSTDDDRIAVYFNSSHLANNEQFDTAVSFPDSAMIAGAVTAKSPTPEAPDYGGDLVGGILAVVINSSCCVPIFVIGLFVVVFSAAIWGSRGVYVSPEVSMDGVGVNKDLDPVEAAMLLRADPRRILTMILFGLLKKGNVKLSSTEPLKLELVSRFNSTYYEVAFLDAIKGDTLNEELLVTCFKLLAQRVVDKTRPFCRKDTEAYYKQRIEDAWSDVKAVDTPMLKLQRYDTAMLWLMADEQFATRTKDSMRAPGWDTATVPASYWWYPYYFGQPFPTATAGQHPVGGTAVSLPQMPANQPTSSVEAFANKVCNSVESVSTGVVGSVEALVGVRNAANAPPAAGSATHHSASSCASCACACAHCACACACAGGGHGCT